MTLPNGSQASGATETKSLNGSKPSFLKKDDIPADVIQAEYDVQKKRALDEGKPENIIGIVHYKDLVSAWRERKTAIDSRRPARPFVLRRYLRKSLVVPETKPLHQLVDDFRKSHTHLAMVVDEFGTITGLVTMEDVLEQIFGEIGDEHDVRRVLPAAGAPVIEVDGGTSILSLASQYGVVLPGDAGFETLAGFVLFKLGYVPSPGDTVIHGEHTFTVQQMDRNRIAKVTILNARNGDANNAKADSTVNG